MVTIVPTGEAALLIGTQLPDVSSARPFPFFCDFQGELAMAVRCGRRREFAQAYAKFGDAIPDPLAEGTFLAAVLNWEARDRPPGRDAEAVARGGPPPGQVEQDRAREHREQEQGGGGGPGGRGDRDQQDRDGQLGEGHPDRQRGRQAGRDPEADDRVAGSGPVAQLSEARRREHHGERHSSEQEGGVHRTTWSATGRRRRKAASVRPPACGAPCPRAPSPSS